MSPQSHPRVNMDRSTHTHGARRRTPCDRLLALLRSDAVRARVELAKYTTEIRMIPEREGGNLQYVGEESWNLFGGKRLCDGCGGRI